MSEQHKRILIVLGFFSPGILAGFARYARRVNWILNIQPVLHGTVPCGWRAHGMLCTNVFRGDLCRFVKETAKLIPTVLHGCDDLGLKVPNVECDDIAAGRMVADHFLEQGHRHFAYFHYSRNLHALRRGEGFHAALAAAGHDCVDLENISAPGAGSGEWFKRRLARLPKPLGLFAEDDTLATTAMESAIELGWQVPEDLAIVGVGNQQALGCELSPVPITSVETPFEAQAYQAAAMLDCLISGKPLKQRTVVLPPVRLIARQSTNSVAAENEMVKKAIACMCERLHDPSLNINCVARSCGVSTRLLYNVFEQDLQSTPMKVLTQIRLRKAKELLITSKEKINAISENCGFANLRTFQRVFHRVEKRSALRWRQNMKRTSIS